MVETDPDPNTDDLSGAIDYRKANNTYVEVDVGYDVVFVWDEDSPLPYLVVLPGSPIFDGEPDDEHADLSDYAPEKGSEVATKVISELASKGDQRHAVTYDSANSHDKALIFHVE